MQFNDQLGRTISLDKFPKRIVSLVPSQTELLFDLGLDSRVVGITKFCIHPNSWYVYKQRVGGTKNVNFELIKMLQPDLIIANKEENTRLEIEQLMKDYPVWVSDIGDLSDALKMILAIGDLTDSSEKALSIVNNVKDNFSHLKPVLNKSVAYVIWNNPIMSVNKTRFIHDMLKRNGLRNVFADIPINYPEISVEALKAANPDIILLSSEPFPFKDKHLTYFKNICPNAKVVLVDGELFSWYGSRLQKSVAYFFDLLKQIC
jgi:ABC-type Fe3+-hydroxamate transport system substrate-binding protein